MAVLVIGCPLLRIRQDRIGLSCLLELFLSLLVPRIGIRMILLGKLSVCFFYGSVIGVLVNSEDLIVIPFFCHGLLSYLPVLTLFP